MRPEAPSRGRVTLRTALPGSKPRIVHNYLATQEDRESMIAGMRLTVELADSRHFVRSRPDRSSRLHRPPTRDLMAYVGTNAQTLYHPTSTCAIGAVVDADLKVLRIDGLRVADASVMPSRVATRTRPRS